MGVTIQQAPLIEQVSGIEKIPISDNSGLPKAVTTEQLKTYIDVPNETTVENWGFTKNQGTIGSEDINLEVQDPTILGATVVSENTNSDIEVASAKLSWNNFIQNKINTNTNIFNSWNTKEELQLEMFILSLKIYSENYNKPEYIEDYFNNIKLSGCTINGNGTVRFNMKNNTNGWVSYNKDITIESGIKEYTYFYTSYKIVIKLNWDQLPQKTLNANYKELVNYNIYPKQDNIIVLDNILWDAFNVKQESILNTFNDFGNFDIQYQDGLCVKATGHSVSKYEATTNILKDTSYIIHGHKYALYFDIDVHNETLLHFADGFGLSILKYGMLCNFPINFQESFGNSYNYKGVSIATAATSYNIESYQWRIRFTYHNNTSSEDTVLDIKINNLTLVDITELQEKSKQELTTIFQQFPYQKQIILNKVTNFTSYNSLYKGLKLRSLGDSLPETYAFQPFIASCLGMDYDPTYDGTTETITWNGTQVTKWRSVLGGTKVTPVITSTTGDRETSGASIYMRAKSLKYDAPDVLIILAGYNDPKAGRTYIEDGSAVQPDDYGLNDKPYLGDEIDLVTNPQSEVPSFGACYRGMIENILQDIPWCRIVLCGIPRGKGEVERYGTDLDWNNKKNAVIERIAKEYGFPYINLADVYGVNKYNYDWLTKDEIHFNEFGGKRVAMEIMAKAF